MTTSGSIPSWRRALRAATVGGTLAGVASLGYALASAHHYALRGYTLAFAGLTRPVRVLHISDLHLAAGQGHREAWLQSLARLQPDLVVATGDFVSQQPAIDRIPVALAPLGQFPGVFVFGSNDYFESRRINPAKYFRGPSKVHQDRQLLDTTQLRAALCAFGWSDLNNASSTVTLNGQEIALVGTGDAHIGLDDYAAVADTWPRSATVRVGVTHAPYTRVLQAMSTDGAEIILAGHTHGGQVNLPGYGPIVSNCDLPPRYAKGVSMFDDAYLHVSAGIGTNPYTPIRVACRPEASLLTLVPTSQNAHRDGECCAAPQ